MVVKRNNDLRVAGVPNVDPTKRRRRNLTKKRRRPVSEDVAKVRAFTAIHARHLEKISNLNDDEPIPKLLIRFPTAHGLSRYMGVPVTTIRTWRRYRGVEYDPLNDALDEMFALAAEILSYAAANKLCTDRYTNTTINSTRNQWARRVDFTSSWEIGDSKLKELTANYLSTIYETGDIPTLAGLAVHSGMSKERLLKKYGGDPDYEECEAMLKTTLEMLILSRIESGEMTAEAGKVFLQEHLGYGANDGGAGVVINLPSEAFGLTRPAPVIEHGG